VWVQLPGSQINTAVARIQRPKVGVETIRQRGMPAHRTGQCLDPASGRLTADRARQALVVEPLGMPATKLAGQV